MIYEDDRLKQTDDHDSRVVTLEFKSRELYDAWRAWWHDAGGELEWFEFLDLHGVDDQEGE